MTTQEIAEQFEIKWAGGPLLPPREGGSSLTEATQARARRGFPVLVAATRTAQKYDEDMKAQVIALRQQGHKLATIAKRLGMAISTASCLARGGRPR